MEFGNSGGHKQSNFTFMGTCFLAAKQSAATRHSNPHQYYFRYYFNFQI